MLALIVKGSFFSFFFLGQVFPDLGLVMVVVLGFLLREKSGAVLGLIGGLLQDLLFGSVLGLFALTKMLIGVAAGLVGREVYRDQIFAPLIVVFIGTFIHETLVFALMYNFIGIEFVDINRAG